MENKTNTWYKIREEEKNLHQEIGIVDAKMVKYSSLLRKVRDDACLAYSALADCARDLKYT